MTRVDTDFRYHHHPYDKEPVKGTRTWTEWYLELIFQFGDDYDAPGAMLFAIRQVRPDLTEDQIASHVSQLAGLSRAVAEAKEGTRTCSAAVDEYEDWLTDLATTPAERHRAATDVALSIVADKHLTAVRG